MIIYVSKLSVIIFTIFRFNLYLILYQITYSSNLRSMIFFLFISKISAPSNLLLMVYAGDPLKIFLENMVKVGLQGLKNSYSYCVLEIIQYMFVRTWPLYGLGCH